MKLVLNNVEYNIKEALVGLDDTKHIKFYIVSDAGFRLIVTFAYPSWTDSLPGVSFDAVSEMALPKITEAIKDEVLLLDEISKKNAEDAKRATEILDKSMNDTKWEPAYYESEVYNLTESFNEWYSEYKIFEDKIETSKTYNIDPLETLTMAKKAKTFMLGPIAKSGFNIIQTKTVFMNSIEQFEIEIGYDNIALLDIVKMIKRHTKLVVYKIRYGVLGIN